MTPSPGPGKEQQDSPGLGGTKEDLPLAPVPEEIEELRPARLPVATPQHVRWRFLELSAALGACLYGGFSPWTPRESRSAALALAASIVTAMAKPLESKDP